MLEPLAEAGEPAEVALLACAGALGVAATDGFSIVAAAVSPGEPPAVADFGGAFNPEIPGAEEEGDGAIEGEGDMEQQL